MNNSILKSASEKFLNKNNAKKKFGSKMLRNKIFANTVRLEREKKVFCENRLNKK